MKTTILLSTIIMATGCSTLLPDATTKNEAPWENFAHAEETIGKIELGVTTQQNLVEWGVDLNNMPNVKHLTYLDVARKFGMVGAVGDERINIPQGVLKLVRAGDKGRAYELEARVIKESRTGNFMLDWLNFRKNRHSTGWEFKVLLIVIDSKIEYVLYSGTPQINTVTRERNPLGPLQSLGGSDIANTSINLIK